MSPGQVRKILTETIARIAPPKDEAAPLRSHTTLYKEEKKCSVFFYVKNLNPLHLKTKILQ